MKRTLVGWRPGGRSASTGGWPQDSDRLLPSPLKMPRRIGPLVLDGEPHNFPIRELGIGLSIQRRRPVADRVRLRRGESRTFPDGADTRADLRAVRRSQGGCDAGEYASPMLKSEQLVRLSPPDDLPQAREARVRIQASKAEPAYSYVWITGGGELFMKMRFTADAALRDEVAGRRVARYSRALRRGHQSAILPTAGSRARRGAREKRRHDDR